LEVIEILQLVVLLLILGLLTIAFRKPKEQQPGEPVNHEIVVTRIDNILNDRVHNIVKPQGDSWGIYEIKLNRGAAYITWIRQV
jgi:hypothetical protein